MSNSRVLDQRFETLRYKPAVLDSNFSEYNFSEYNFLSTVSLKLTLKDRR